jgi:hypothetical protein
MITLAELNSDPRFRKMKEEDLSVALLCGLVFEKDWIELPGEESTSKARNLLAKWKAEDEAKSEDMVCRWVKYADRKPTEDGEYDTINDCDERGLKPYRIDRESFLDWEGFIADDPKYWLEGLTLPPQEDK